MFDTTTTPFFQPILTSDFRIGYKDSLAIEEVKLIRFITDTAGNESTETVLMHYAFIYPASKSFYYYKTFPIRQRLLKNMPELILLVLMVVGIFILKEMLNTPVFQILLMILLLIR